MRSMGEQRILKGTTGTLVSYPRVSPDGPYLLKQPTSVTVRVRTPVTEMPDEDEGEEADVDDLEATVDMLADEGADSVRVDPLTDFTGGRRYLLQHDDFTLDVVCAHTVADTDTLQLAEPLVREVPVDTEVLGWACSYALSADDTEEVGEGLALWTAVVDGKSYTWAQAFRIVERMPVSTLTPTRLTQAWPIMRALASRKDRDLEEAIRIGWEYRVLPLLASRGIDEEDIIAVDALEPLHAIAVVMHYAEGNPKVDAQLMERLEKTWASRIELTFSSKLWYAAPQTEDPASRPQGPPPVKTGIGLVR